MCSLIGKMALFKNNVDEAIKELRKIDYQHKYSYYVFKYRGPIYGSIVDGLDIGDVGLLQYDTIIRPYRGRIKEILKYFKLSYERSRNFKNEFDIIFKIFKGLGNKFGKDHFIFFVDFSTSSYSIYLRISKNKRLGISMLGRMEVRIFPTIYNITKNKTKKEEFKEMQLNRSEKWRVSRYMNLALGWRQERYKGEKLKYQKFYKKLLHEHKIKMKYNL